MIGGRDHGRVVATILAANLALVALAGIAAAPWLAPGIALAGAVLVVGVLLYFLARPARNS